MSASGIADALLTMLQATSAFGANGCDKDYRVLQTSSGSCCVVSWTNFELSPQGFGGLDSINENLWTFSLEAFVRHTGGGNVLPRTLSTIDTIINLLKDDQTIQGTVEEITGVRGSRTPGEAFEINGQLWLRMPIEVDCREWADG